MIVVDASILVHAVADDSAAGRTARARLRGERLNAPTLVDLEVVSAIRRTVLRGGLDEARAVLALRGFAAARLRRTPHGPLLPRIWALRENLTPYDAAYVALAEAMNIPLLTADHRLAGATKIFCEVELLR